MFNKPRGTNDIYGKNIDILNFCINNLVSLCKKYGFSEISTPIYEHIDTFVRSIGDSTDVIKKELFNFKDKGDREIALRPEGTASVIRAIVEDKLLFSKSLPLRFFYSGPMFRYERPQSGRSRQFHQIGCELISTKSIYDDVNCLKLAIEGINILGISNYKILINNIGSFDSRKKWIASLQKYFQKYKAKLSPLSQERIKTNPLRILDDKVDGTKDFVLNCPSIEEFLSQTEIEYNKKLFALLKQSGIKYIVDKTLVRGLDYYTNFVFEIVSNDKILEGQSTICGGGRYNKLVSEFGAPDSECVGFAWGVSRICSLLNNNNNIKNDTIDVVIISLADETNDYAFSIISDLHKNNISAISIWSCNKIKKGFDCANEKNAKCVFIIGNDELSKKTITIKDQKTLKSDTIKYSEIIKYYKKKYL